MAAAADGWLMTDDDGGGGGVVDGSSIDDYDAVLFVGCVVLVACSCALGMIDDGMCGDIVAAAGQFRAFVCCWIVCSSFCVACRSIRVGRLQGGQVSWMRFGV